MGFPCCRKAPDQCQRCIIERRPAVEPAATSALLVHAALPGMTNAAAASVIRYLAAVEPAACCVRST